MLDYINSITDIYEKEYNSQTLAEQLAKTFTGFTNDQAGKIYNEFVEVSNYIEKLYNLLLTR